MGGGTKDWSGIMTVSGSTSDLSWISCAVGVRGARLNAGATLVFLEIYTGLTLAASRPRVLASLLDSVSKTLAMP